MSKKNIPCSFDDRSLPSADISMERSLEIDNLMKERVEKIKIQLCEKIAFTPKKEATKGN